MRPRCKRGREVGDSHLIYSMRLVFFDPPAASPAGRSELPNFATRLHCLFFSFAIEFQCGIEDAKRIKNINLLFLWLTGLLFFSHGITPHHHHFDSVFEHGRQTGHPDEHSEDSPLHCHSFNDLAVDKTGVSTINISIPESFKTIISGNDMHLRVIANPSGKITVANQDDAPPEVAFVKNSPTRGSPVTA